jgi:hypothetical protein
MQSVQTSQNGTQLVQAEFNQRLMREYTEFEIARNKKMDFSALRQVPTSRSPNYCGLPRSWMESK